VGLVQKDDRPVYTECGPLAPYVAKLQQVHIFDRVFLTYQSSKRINNLNENLQ